MHPSAPRRTRTALMVLGLVAGTTASIVATSAPAGAASTTIPVTSRASVTTAGAQLGGAGSLDGRVLVDGTGRYAFFSTKRAYGTGDTNGSFDVYRRDRIAGTTTRVSTLANGDQITVGDAHLCGASDDGRYIGWAGAAATAGGIPQVYLKDTKTGALSTVSLSSAEVVAGNGGASGIDTTEACPVSADGRYVAFTSAAGNLVANDSNSSADVFYRDRTAGTTVRLSVASDGTQGNGASNHAAMSDDGLDVVFESTSSNLVALDSNLNADVFLRIVLGGTTERVNLSSIQAQNAVGGHNPAISGDGRYVAYVSSAANVVPDDTNGVADVFLRDRQDETAELISVTSNEMEANQASSSPSISDDGRYVAFSSAATNLYPLDGNGAADTFVRDRIDGRTDLLSRTNGLAVGNQASAAGAAISDDGTIGAFTSLATNLVRNDTNNQADVFVRDAKATIAPFTSIDALVTQQYADFAGRAPSAAERTEWTARLQNGEYSTDGFIDAMAHSGTWSGKRAPVIRLYWAFFLRIPDTGGLDYWVGKYAAGTTLNQIAKSFAASSEFQNTYGSLSNTDFVTLVYQNVLQREPDAGGLAFWVAKLDAGTKSRGDVMVNFSESSEGTRFLAPQVDVVLVHLGMLRTMPSKGFFGAATIPIANGQLVIEQIIAVERAAAAYVARVG